LAAQPAQPRLRDLDIGQVDAGDAGAADLEDQLFLMVQAPVARDGGNFIVLRRPTGRWARRGRAALIVHAHRRAPFKAVSKAAKSSSVFVSVAATIRRLAAAGSCGSRREAGTPAITPLAASASTSGAAGLDSF